MNSFHVGSTSVPNSKAKPIIDILLVVIAFIKFMLSSMIKFKKSEGTYLSEIIFAKTQKYVRNTGN
ncbi:GrpB family protein [Paenibacillus odorifer]|uniref:GrpB family protein n=1 Tax=Paenibacillus sp. FSL R5-0923 TaxID=2921666 RepID=UPI002115EB91|nr:GrpB family protein [Paenibacillus odorifer]